MSFTRTELVRYQHCDAAGIVFYPRYVEMVNATVEDWFAERIGCSFAEIHGPMNAAIPAVSLTLEFFAPSRLGELLTFDLTVGRVGTSSVASRIACKGGDQVRFRAALTLVHISKVDYRSRPWPEDMREILEHEAAASARAGQDAIAS